MALTNSRTLPRGCPDGRLHNGCLPLLGDLLRATAARAVLHDGGYPATFIPPSPQQHGGQRCRQLAREDVVGNSFSRPQDDVDARNNPSRCAAMAAECQELLTLRL